MSAPQLDPLLLVLDLDETLVHARDEPLARAPDFQAFSYSVYLRPFAREFLEACATEHRLAVWTSSGSDYAEAIVQWLFGKIPLEFLWASERCTVRYDPDTLERYCIKPLKKVKKRGYNLGRTLMVDDTPRKLERNYGNHLRIRPWEGDLHDRELVALLAYLKLFRDLPDVRPIEKRYWHIHTGDQQG